jgi:hypothetical protein
MSSGDNRTPDQVATSEERKQQVVDLRRRGIPFGEIGATLDPPVSKQRAHQIWAEALSDIAGPTVELARQEILDRLDNLVRLAYEVLERNHITISNGKIVVHDGITLTDDGPVLAAIREIRKLDDSRARLLGANAPVRTEVGGDVSVRHEVIGVDLSLLT